jgi:hypothetical protein
MISPTDTAYPVLSPSPSARELMDSFTPNLFELSFAEGVPARPLRVSICWCY